MSETDVGGGFGEPRSSGSGSGDSPKEMAANAAQAVKQEAASFAADARDKAVDKVEQHKQTATQTLGDFANAIRKAGDELAQSDQSAATRVVRQAADGLESLARSVSDKRPEELLDAARDFGRRNPAALVAGSVLAGIALGRFLKSSGTSSSGGAAFSSSTPVSFSGGIGSSAASYSAPGGAPDLGLSSDLAADPVAVGATSIGVPADEIGPAPTLEGIEGPLGETEEDMAAARSGDLDHSRYGAGS
jgi:hypothetical protein